MIHCTQSSRLAKGEASEQNIQCDPKKIVPSVTTAIALRVRPWTCINVNLSKGNRVDLQVALTFDVEGSFLGR